MRSAKLQNAGDVPGDLIVGAVEALLDENNLCSISTVTPDGLPHICTGYFAPAAGLQLIIFTGPETRHGINLAANPAAAICIFDSHQKWGGPLRGVQLFGTMQLTSGVGAVRAFGNYAKRFAGLLASAKAYPDLEGVTDSRFFVFSPETVKVLDEPRFGHRKYLTSQIANS